MNKDQIKNEMLKQLLAETDMEQPSPQFADRLVHRMVHSYKPKYATIYKKEERLGKAIILVLITFNLLLFYKLDPFIVQPALFICLGIFLLVFCLCIWVLKRKLLLP